jgi:hypothetical protein
LGQQLQQFAKFGGDRIGQRPGRLGLGDGVQEMADRAEGFGLFAQGGDSLGGVEGEGRSELPAERDGLAQGGEGLEGLVGEAGRAGELLQLGEFGFFFGAPCGGLVLVGLGVALLAGGRGLGSAPSPGTNRTSRDPAPLWDSRSKTPS